MRRDWHLEATRMLSESCQRHLTAEEHRSGGRRARAACLDCLAEALERVYRVGIADGLATALDEEIKRR